ncbi:integrator complex subunit 7-like [Antedon mediterranea]|uniref:integrator complex subunit 7-like n=1 Tax=Antedon mediterranea TaxID=105859 RepID=UPI003AF94538
MATVAARLTSFGEANYGEPEQDANSALMELDKGLRSTKVGEQCEAIVRFPRMFEKYPFPILINSAFLKLADVFRDGNNFLRLCVLKVTQQSEKQLDKILNTDEFLRRIFFVIHSNDPVARAITLRVLGGIAPIIAERKNVHHSIRSGLDSHDKVELEAAIFAANRFAEQSKVFAVGICNKLSEMIEGLATPVEMKLKLIEIFEHMHHDGASAFKVRHLCVSKLQSYPARDFVLVTLHTMSKLASMSLVDIPEQICLLLKYLHNDPRHTVKTIALQDLHMLANKAPHMWTTENVDSLCEFCSTTTYNGLIIGALTVLSALSKTVALNILDLAHNSRVVKLCGDFCYVPNVTIASHSIQIMTNIATKGLPQSQAKSVVQEVSMATESLIMICALQDGKDAINAIKIALTCVRSLCQAHSSLSPEFVENLCSLVGSSTGKVAVLLCQCLVTLAQFDPSLVCAYRNSLQELLNITAQSSMDETQQKLFISVAALLLLSQNSSDKPKKLSEFFLDKLGQSQDWTVFRVARQAARLGCHCVAADLFGNLTTKVASEHYYFWLSSLNEFCKAEQLFTEPSLKLFNLTQSLAEATQHYEKGIVALKAATTPTHQLQFQCEYTRLRCDMLHAFKLLITASASIRTCPPPAIAPAVAMSTGVDLQKCGRMALQMQNCHGKLRQLGSAYSALQQASFDADPKTLENLTVLQEICLLLAYIIDVLILSNPMYGGKSTGNLQDVLDLQSQTSAKSSSRVMQACLKVLQNTQEALQRAEGQSVSHLHSDCLFQACHTLLLVPIGYPRYFFQSLQSTAIKLAVSPTPRGVGEPIMVHVNTRLALKVEGVIQHGQKPGLFRKIKQVTLHVTSSITQRHSKSSEHSKQTEPSSNDLRQNVEPHNDFFSTQFLLQFGIAGTHQVNVETTVIDEEGTIWKTGPKLSLNIKAYDDTLYQRPQTSQPPPPPSSQAMPAAQRSLSTNR